MKTLIIGATLILSTLTVAAQTAYPTHPGTGAGIYFSPGYAAMRRQAMLRGAHHHAGQRRRRSASRHHHRAAAHR